MGSNSNETYSCATRNCETELDSKNATRYEDGSVRLLNPNIKLMNEDFLYHLALDSGNHDLALMFGDVKFVCMGGTSKRMETFAHYMMDELGIKLSTGTQLYDISNNSNRYSMYKVGPILSISHGIGVPSLTILLHEVIKLMYYARCKDPIFVRLGSCGGIGIEGGTVVITNKVVDEQLRHVHELAILGKLVQRPAVLNQKLVYELKALASLEDGYKTVVGTTMCSNDFYEGQGRLDGAFCNHTAVDKMQYLKKLQEFGVVNIEMECTAFAAFTHKAGIRSAIVCVAYLNRLESDQVTTPKEILNHFQNRPLVLISRYIKKYLAEKVTV